jgi:hypothetical protein
MDYIIYAYSGETLINVISTGTSLSYTITGLVNEQSYSFVAIAKNNIGASLKSNKYMNVIPTLRPIAPSIASAIRGNSKVTINLTASVSSVEYPILEYIVYA